jgi:hypothetical protein
MEKVETVGCTCNPCGNSYCVSRTEGAKFHIFIWFPNQNLKVFLGPKLSQTKVRNN